MSDPAFQGIVEFVKETYDIVSQAAIARRLDMQQTQVSTYQRNGPARISSWKKIAKCLFDLGYQGGQRETAQLLMSGITETFGEVSQSDLAKALRVSQPTVSNWLRGSALPSKLNFEKLLGLHVSRLAEPLVEFHAIRPGKSGHSWRLYDDREEEAHLRDLLSERIGIYIFYDSAGRVTVSARGSTSELSVG